MKIAIFNTQDYEKTIFDALKHNHNFIFITESLSLTTIEYAKGCDGVSCFVSDNLDSTIINKLASYGTKLITLRSAGFDHVDLAAARSAGITVTHVPAYSPEAIAEFAVTLILVLSRKILQSYTQVSKNNFSLNGLMGFNLYKKTVGVVGTGNIGTAFVKIMNGFGCRVLAMDPQPNDSCKKLNVDYVSLDNLLRESDIISLHCPLNEHTMHVMNKKTFAMMKQDAMLINTGRGGLCDTQALIDALQSGNLGYAGLDVYENEQNLFFKDRSGETIHDQIFLKLRSLPNVLITPHQAFLTREAVENIVQTTISNITAFEQGNPINQIG